MYMPLYDNGCITSLFDFLIESAKELIVPKLLFCQYPAVNVPLPIKLFAVMVVCLLMKQSGAALIGFLTSVDI